MSENEPVEEGLDPFSPENIGVFQWITAARIYDVLLALLTEKDKEAGRRLVQAHADGKLVGPMPVFFGEFIYNLVNEGLSSEDDDETDAEG